MDCVADECGEHNKSLKYRETCDNENKSSGVSGSHIVMNNSGGIIEVAGGREGCVESVGCDGFRRCGGGVVPILPPIV